MQLTATLSRAIFEHVTQMHWTSLLSYLGERGWKLVGNGTICQSADGAAYPAVEAAYRQMVMDAQALKQVCTTDTVMVDAHSRVV